MCAVRPYKYFIAYGPEYEVVNLNSGSSALRSNTPGYATFYFSLSTLPPPPTSFLNASGPVDRRFITEVWTKHERFFPSNPFELVECIATVFRHLGSKFVAYRKIFVMIHIRQKYSDVIDFSAIQR